MKYNDLQLDANRPTHRVGRGIAAGQGKTAGRGTKGQKSRTGKGRKPGFEGGQNPLMQRLPKLPGFHSIRPKKDVIYTGQLDSFTGTVDNMKIFEAGLVDNPHTDIKLILKGEVTKKITLHIQSVSTNAKAAVVKAGGSIKLVPRLARLPKDKNKDN
ncbi:MAG: 50S ribosomal protein L15 [Candidatus Saccharimonadales bacterium]